MQSEKLRYKSLPVILLAFLLLGLILFVERSGFQSRNSGRGSLLIQADTVTARQTIDEKSITCLVITDSTKTDSSAALPQVEQIFLDMKVGYQIADIFREKVPPYSQYQTVVVLISDLASLQDEVLELCQWVKNGGRALFPLTIQKSNYSDLIEHKLGILSSEYGWATVDSVHPSPEFMLGGGIDYTIMDPTECAWLVNLDESAIVHVWSADDKKLPLIWEHPYGEGKFVVINFGIYEKSTRGFFAAAYSLLEDVSAYPVINASAFFLDDFLAPLPDGEQEFIRRDYQMDLRSFYRNIWWPDVLQLTDQYGVKFTGVIIENYEDDTSGLFLHSKDTMDYQYFGNMLLHYGGELGYHGYNHQPLALNNTNYSDDLPYKTWDTYETMHDAVSALISFCEDQFPTVEMSLYVPPSNILSPEGRTMLGEKFPTIRIIASNYFCENDEYEQEFEVAEDYMVELPRVVSGCVMDDYQRMTALSELNMHYVNSHFFHPDDVLDPDRGAALGWEKMRDSLEEYVAWVTQSAPGIRQLTGSEAAGAVQRFSAVNVRKTVEEDKVLLTVDHLYDEAYLMLRFNDGKPGAVTGGELTHLGGKMYLLHAEQENVTIERVRNERI